MVGVGEVGGVAAKAYSELCETFKLELFTKIVNGF